MPEPPLYCSEGSQGQAAGAAVEGRASVARPPPKEPQEQDACTSLHQHNYHDVVVCHQRQHVAPPAGGEQSPPHYCRPPPQTATACSQASHGTRDGQVPPLLRFVLLGCGLACDGLGPWLEGTTCTIHRLEKTPVIGDIAAQHETSSVSSVKA